MSAARAAMAAAAVRHEVVADELLTLLALESERAGSLLGFADASPLIALLDVRDAMLDALEGATDAFTRAQAPHELTQSTTIRAELIARASALQQANIQLLARVRAECDRLAGAIADADRPDGVATAYAGSGAEGIARLDLVR